MSAVSKNILRTLNSLFIAEFEYILTFGKKCVGACNHTVPEMKIPFTQENPN